MSVREGKVPNSMYWKEQCGSDKDMKKGQHTWCWATRLHGPASGCGMSCAGRRHLLSWPVLGVLKPFSLIS